MTINLGPIDTWVTHYGESPLTPLCKMDQLRGITSMNMATTDKSKVTCTSCIEYLHA